MAGADGAVSEWVGPWAPRAHETLMIILDARSGVGVQSLLAALIDASSAVEAEGGGEWVDWRLSSTPHKAD